VSVPFTVNGTDTLAYTTATHFIGFQVSSIATGKALFTVPVPGFSLPAEFTGPPSHGISLSPDEQRLYVMDAPNDYVHVFDVSGLPASAPTLLANIKLSSRSGEESPCAYDCGKSGWLQASRDGRYVFVGDTGDVIDTGTLAIVKTLPPLAETRQLLEVDWAAGLPTATTSRYGLGYVTGGGSSSLTSPAPGAGLGGATVPSGGTLRGPVIGGLSISPSAFRAKNARSAIAHRHSSVAARVRYRESEAALSTFTVLERVAGVEEGSKHRCVAARRSVGHRKRHCWRYVVVGHFTHRDRAGSNSFGFTGAVGARRLARADYRLRVVPSASGQVGAAHMVAFRILP
jgi:hypothetical protein